MLIDDGLCLCSNRETINKVDRQIRSFIYLTSKKKITPSIFRARMQKGLHTILALQDLFIYVVPGLESILNQLVLKYSNALLGNKIIY